MAKRALKEEATVKQTGSGAPAVSADTLQVKDGLHSPARQLQNYLDGEIRQDGTAVKRWSTRRTTLFVVATCGTFWAAVWIAARLLIG